ncbi:MAG: hypothetical protein AB7F19_00150 [Candidatus Babeliales bacterium]
MKNVSFTAKAAVLLLASGIHLHAMKAPQVTRETVLAQIEQLALSQGNKEAAQSYLSGLASDIQKIATSASVTALPTQAAQLQARLKEGSERVRKAIRESRGMLNHAKLVELAQTGRLPRTVSKSDFEAYMKLYRPLPKLVLPKSKELTTLLAQALKPIYQAGIKTNDIDEAVAMLTMAFYTAIKNLGASATTEMKEIFNPQEIAQLVASGGEEAVLLKKYTETAAPYVPALQSALKAISDAGKQYKFESIYDDANAELGDVYLQWGNLMLSKF